MLALPPNITPCLERYATWLGRNTLNPAALAASSSSARWYSCFSIWKLLIRKRIERDLGEQLSIQEVLSSPSAPGWTCGSRVFPFWYWWILCDFFGQIPCYVIPISLHFGPRLSLRYWYFRQVLLVHMWRICMKPGPMIHPLFMLPGMLTSGSVTLKKPFRHYDAFPEEEPIRRHHPWATPHTPMRLPLPLLAALCLVSVAEHLVLRSLMRISQSRAPSGPTRWVSYKIKVNTC